MVDKVEREFVIDFRCTECGASGELELELARIHAG